MSHFIYGNHTKKHIGVWLRYRSNPDVIQLIKKSGKTTIVRHTLIMADKFVYNKALQ